MGHSDIDVTARIYTEVQTDMAISTDAQVQAYLESVAGEHGEKLVNKSAADSAGNSENEK